MSLSLLTMGGIAAVVASGWTQVKNVFSYISSFIVVTAEMDRATSRAVTYLLRDEWKLLPSGKLTYISVQLWFNSVRKTKLVPFRIPATKAIYTKGKKVLFISGANQLKVTFLRGTMKMDDLISLALDRADERVEARNAVNANRNRYHLTVLTGKEKTGFDAAELRTARGDNSTEPSSGGDSDLEGDSVVINTTLDKSFKYDSEEWMQTSTTNPFESLYYPPEIEKYIRQAERWKNMEQWYSDRSIPWRRGWLLHGGPGTGKTSLSTALAKRLGMPIYVFNLNTMSDQELIKFWNNMPRPCMAVFEDFDNVFHGRIPQTEHKLLSFDCVLNTIGGAKEADGVFLVVTTNDLSKIDPAMGVVWGTDGAKKGISSRPGRIDTVIELTSIQYPARLKLASRILVDWPEAIQEIVAGGEGCSAVQFQELCLQYANERLEKDFFKEEEVEILDRYAMAAEVV